MERGAPSFLCQHSQAAYLAHRQPEPTAGLLGNFTAVTLEREKTELLTLAKFISNSIRWC